MERPVIGITMGDPCGIGPEVTVRALAHDEITDRMRPLIVGSIDVCKRAAELTGCPLAFRAVSSVRDARFARGTVDVLDLPVTLSRVPFGQVTAEGGEAAFRAVEKVIGLAMADEVDATVT